MQLSWLCVSIVNRSSFLLILSIDFELDTGPVPLYLTCVSNIVYDALALRLHGLKNADITVLPRTKNSSVC